MRSNCLLAVPIFSASLDLAPSAKTFELTDPEIESTSGSDSWFEIVWAVMVVIAGHTTKAFAVMASCGLNNNASMRRSGEDIGRPAKKDNSGVRKYSNNRGFEPEEVHYEIDNSG